MVMAPTTLERTPGRVNRVTPPEGTTAAISADVTGDLLVADDLRDLTEAEDAEEAASAGDVVSAGAWSAFVVYVMVVASHSVDASNMRLKEIGVTMGR